MARVMIVENPEKPFWVARKLLSAINHEIVFETGNGYEAIEKYNIIKPDLLLLDLILSKNDGLSVLKEIKKSYKIFHLIGYRHTCMSTKFDTIFKKFWVWE